MKRRIRQSIWGNWNGYEGTKKVLDFGLDELEAKRWLEDGKTTTIRINETRPAPRVIKLG
jgi:hypothetical protein